MEQRELHAVVFDFDGLVVDSEPLQIRAWQEFLARYDRKLEPEVIDEMFGLRVRDSAIVVQHKLDLPMTPDEVMAGRDDIFLQLVATELPLMPGAVELIQYLRNETTLRLALATSGHRKYIGAALAVTGLTDAFEQTVTGDDVTHGKPHPEIYLSAAEKLGVAPERCLALEDAPHGVRSAKDAGMMCIAVPNEMTASIPGLDAADMVLESLTEVQGWIAKKVLGVRL